MTAGGLGRAALTPLPPSCRLAGGDLAALTPLRPAAFKPFRTLEAGVIRVAAPSRASRERSTIGCYSSSCPQLLQLLLSTTSTAPPVLNFYSSSSPQLLQLLLSTNSTAPPVRNFYSSSCPQLL